MIIMAIVYVSYRNVFQNGIKTFSKMVNNCLSNVSVSTHGNINVWFGILFFGFEKCRLSVQNVFCFYFSQCDDIHGWQCTVTPKETCLQSGQSKCL